MKSLTILFAICMVPLWATEIESELKVECNVPDYDTGTTWFQESVTYTLEGFAPLRIEADLERGLYPADVKEIHELGEARYLVVGGFSTGGGMWTTVARIVRGESGRLLIQDTLEFTRDRRGRSYHVRGNAGAFSIAFAPVPTTMVEAHALHDWEIILAGKQYDVDAVRRFALVKLPEMDKEMIIFSIDKNGFVAPKVRRKMK